MKNIKLISMALFVLLMITACGGKSLTCSMEEELLGDITVTMDFDSNDEVKTAKTVTTMDYGVEPTKEDLEELCEASEEEGMTCKASNDGTEITLELEIDYTKLSDEAKEEMGYEDTGYEAMKKDAEENGFECE